MIQSVDTLPGVASKMGIEYEIADGTRIPNKGEQKRAQDDLSDVRFVGVILRSHFTYVGRRVVPCF